VGYAYKAAVIGAGLSGLACAYRLKQLGIHPIVFESTEGPGGVIRTVRRDGFVFEGGPQCPRFPAPVWALVKELNLEKEFLYGDRKAKRYIWKEGQLHPAPFSPFGLVTTRLVDTRSKLRILGEMFGSTLPPDHEESLAEFIERKFGSEVLEYLVDPFISTVFLGDAGKMGMESAFPAFVEWERNHGSLMRGAIRGSLSRQRWAESERSPTTNRHETNRRSLHLSDALPSLGSFTSGMGMLPERLSETLGESMKYGAKAESLELVKSEKGAATTGWRVRLSGGEEITAGCLLLAVPAYVAARLLEKSAPQLSALLGEIAYAPMCSVSLAYERAQVFHSLDGFGFMVPRREGLNTICTFWNSSLFGGRAPEGKVLMTSFAGRHSNEALAASSDEECARTIHAENARTLGIRGEPVEQMVWRYPRALPQYNVGHAKRVAEIRHLLETLPNLGLVGNYLAGRSIGDCVELASRAAEKLNSRMQELDI
jgi:oxygen-dependent protoporphyrinogen oxidase